MPTTAAGKVVNGLLDEGHHLETSEERLAASIKTVVAGCAAEETDDGGDDKDAVQTAPHAVSSDRSTRFRPFSDCAPCSVPSMRRLRSGDVLHHVIFKGLQLVADGPRQSRMVGALLHQLPQE